MRGSGKTTMKAIRGLLVNAICDEKVKKTKQKCIKIVFVELECKLRYAQCLQNKSVDKL